MLQLYFVLERYCNFFHTCSESFYQPTIIIIIIIIIITFLVFLVENHQYMRTSSQVDWMSISHSLIVSPFLDHSLLTSFQMSSYCFGTFVFFFVFYSQLFVNKSKQILFRSILSLTFEVTLSVQTRFFLYLINQIFLSLFLYLSI